MLTRTRLLMVAVVSLWAVSLHQMPLAARDSPVCEELCASVSCDEECWLTQFAFDNGYPPTTCGDEGYACCGDGVCDSSIEYCGSCTEDCGGGPTCESECVYDFNCSSGEVCNSSHQCVSPAPNNSGNEGDTSCSNKGNCYEPDACMDSGECAIPHKDECDGGYACPNTEWCVSNVNLNSYCDPGNNRCMYRNQPGCPLPPE